MQHGVQVGGKFDRYSAPFFRGATQAKASAWDGAASWPMRAPANWTSIQKVGHTSEAIKLAEKIAKRASIRQVGMMGRDRVDRITVKGSILGAGSPSLALSLPEAIGTRGARDCGR